MVVIKRNTRIMTNTPTRYDIIVIFHCTTQGTLEKWADKIIQQHLDRLTTGNLSNIFIELLGVNGGTNLVRNR